jgi:hypothetical protein
MCFSHGGLGLLLDLRISWRDPAGIEAVVVAMGPVSLAVSIVIAVIVTDGIFIVLCSVRVCALGLLPPPKLTGIGAPQEPSILGPDSSYFPLAYFISLVDEDRDHVLLSDICLP